VGGGGGEGDLWIDGRARSPHGGLPVAARAAVEIEARAEPVSDVLDLTEVLLAAAEEGEL